MANRPGHVYAGLDLARRAGVAVGEPFGIPESVTWNLGDVSRPERFVRLRARLIPFLYRWRPRMVFIEEPLPARVMIRIGATLDVQLSLTGYVAIAESVCAQMDVPTKLIARQAVLGHFTGQKSYKDAEDGKRACVMRCKQLRYPIEGYDEADAAALWDYGCAHENPREYAMVGINRPWPAGGSLTGVGHVSGTRKARGRGKRGIRRSLPLFKGHGS